MKLSGLFSAVTTPLDSDGKIDFASFERNLTALAERGVDGFVVPGTTGEAVYLDLVERTMLWQAAARLCKKLEKTFIAGTGTESTRDTIRLTQAAAEMGAKAALVVTPSFYKPGPDALIAHFRAVADASPIPVLLYNYPAFTGQDIPSAAVITLAEHPNITGMKDSSANLVKLASVLAMRPDFAIFSGLGSGLLPFLGMGGAGAILALCNVASAPLKRMMEAEQAGQHAEAVRIQLSLAALSEALEVKYGIPAIKYAMDCIGLYGGPVRPPLQPLGEAGRLEIDRLVADLLGAHRLK